MGNKSRINSTHTSVYSLIRHTHNSLGVPRPHRAIVEISLPTRAMQGASANNLDLARNLDAILAELARVGKSLYPGPGRRVERFAVVGVDITGQRQSRRIGALDEINHDSAMAVGHHVD